MSKEIKKEVFLPVKEVPKGGKVVAINQMSTQKEEQGRTLSESELLQSQGWEVTETKTVNGVKSHVLVKSKSDED